MTNSAFQGGERMFGSLTALAIHLIFVKVFWLKPIRVKINLTNVLIYDYQRFTDD